MLDGRREEDRRIYERSARLILLMAMREAAPQAKVRFEHSLGRGVYATVEGLRLSAAFLADVEARMRGIVRRDLPIARSRHTKEEAIRLFRAAGQEDTVRLLKYRPYDYFDLYTCGDYSEYFYGAMAASTGEIGQFALRLYYPGMVLLLPGYDFSQPPAPLADRPKLTRAYREAKEEARICGIENTADLNEILASGGMRNLIRVSEALQQRRIAAVADRASQSGARMIFVAGPSSSGKTTFANRLSVQLQACGRRPVAISLDDYYRSRQDVPLGEDGKPDLECLEAIDVPLFGEHLIRLLDGERVEIPRYSFQTKMREKKGVPLSLGPEDMLVVEGIHALNPALSEGIPGGYKFLVYVSALTSINLDNHNRIRATDARLLRRLVRDHRTRGAGVDETLAMWDSVRAGEEKYIYPYQESANVLFNTSLPYELAILKKYAYDLLHTVREDSPYFTRCRRLLKFLNYFTDSRDESELPPTSILREFVGGCTFYGEA